MKHTEPVLVMESRGVTPNTRSFRFSDTWSRLYRIDKYFLDLSYHPSEHAARLHGQVLNAAGETLNAEGKVSLYDRTGQEVVNVPLNKFGQFNLSMTPMEIYKLVVEMQNDSLVIPAFSSS